MDETVKCFVCHMKTDDWRNELDGLKSQHSSTFITDFIKKILGDFQTRRNVDDRSNCICVDCLNRFEEYDWSCTVVKQHEKELYDLLVHTESLCFTEKKNDEPTIVNTEPSIGRPYLDPLSGFVSDDIDGAGDDDLLNAMAEPLFIPEQLPDEDDLAMDCGAIENIGDSDSEAKSNHGEEDNEYLPNKKVVKAKKTEAGTIKVKSSDVSASGPASASAPKKHSGPKKQVGPEDEISSRTKRGKNIYECKDCDIVFDKRIELLAHERWHCKKLIPKFRCPKCLYVSENQEAFDTHKKLHENTAAMCIMKYRCDICNFDTLENEDELAKHKEMHIGLSPLQCVVCKKTFSNKRNIRSHMRLHTGQKRHEYQCDRCGKDFGYKKTLMRHMANHDGIRTEKCQHCARVFKLKSDLKRHLQVHAGEKPYACDICGKRFCRRDNVKLHRKIHNKQEQDKKEKAYSCSHCDASFQKLSKLQKHMEKHGVMSFASDTHLEKRLNDNDNNR